MPATGGQSTLSIAAWFGWGIAALLLLTNILTIALTALIFRKKRQDGDKGQEISYSDNATIKHKTRA